LHVNGTVTATQFNGNGAGLTNVIAQGLDPSGVLNLWRLDGNAGTDPTTNVLGTTDNQALELRVNGARALRLEPGASPNLVGGWSGNQASAGTSAATIGGGDVQAGVNRPPATEPGASVGVNYRTQRDDANNVSSVRTLEGMETYISIGQSVPVNTTQVSRGWGGVTVQQSTDFRSANTGFYATARLSGETVTLEFSPQQQRLRSSARGPVVETAGAITTIRGRLGEWLALGAVQESNSSGATGLLVWGRQAGSSQYSIWIKVDEVP
jgi:hypothetical protein